MRRIGSWLVLGFVVAVALGEALPASAQGSDALALTDQAIRLYKSGQPTKAIGPAQRALTEWEKQDGPEHVNVAIALDTLGQIYLASGRMRDAEQSFIRSRRIFEKAVGPSHAQVGQSLNNLGEVYRALGRFAEAEALYTRSLRISEKAHGVTHLETGVVHNNLGLVQTSLGRYAQAEASLRRGISIYEKGLGANHARLILPLNNLGHLLSTQGRFNAAEPILRRALAMAEKASGSSAQEAGLPLNNLALLLVEIGRYGEAEPLAKRAIALFERVVGPEHPSLVMPLNNLGMLYINQSRYAEAEPALKRAIAISEKSLGAGNVDIAYPLSNLGLLYTTQGRLTESEALFRRALAMTEKVLGSEHVNVGLALNNIANALIHQERLAEAEEVSKRAFRVAEKVHGLEHAVTAKLMINLAELYRRLGRPAAADEHFRKAVAVAEKVLGPEHPEFSMMLSMYGDLRLSEGRLDEAEGMFRRALEIRQKVLSADSHHMGIAFSDLAAVAFARGDWTQAADHWRRRGALITARADRGVGDVGRDAFGREAQRTTGPFLGLVSALHRTAPPGHVDREKATREAFEAAQRAQGSLAAASLSQMAARGARGDAGLAAVIRERQDLIREWEALDKKLTAARGAAASSRNAAEEKANATRVAAIDASLTQIGVRLARDFPDYLALIAPASVPLAETQALLADDEALVLLLAAEERKPAPEETFVWVVTRREVRWHSAPIGSKGLRREVAALRCGLDAVAWLGEGTARCAELLQRPSGEAPRADALPFDTARAHRLYQALLGPAADLIKGQHLLIVPSDALTQLPPQVLVTAPPAADGKGPIAWLARAHAVTVLPAVSALRALRRTARPSTATRQMIGFGNPLLDGDPAKAEEVMAAKRAREAQACVDRPTEKPSMQVASLGRRGAGSARVTTTAGVADAAHLRLQLPLPETADELCEVARQLSADVREMRLAGRATEREVKALSASGALATYRVVHFATHGMLAGDILGTTEPGLVLTPPGTQSMDDDGYLSASEISALRLDANWVILSACNTAGAAGAESAEALSGLARAFFYAGARAMLVSHWEVNSRAAVSLVKASVGVTARDPGIGRAEALRSAMLALIDSRDPREASPAYWAPFVVIGEGGAGR